MVSGEKKDVFKPKIEKTVLRAGNLTALDQGGGQYETREKRRGIKKSKKG